MSVCLYMNEQIHLVVFILAGYGGITAGVAVGCLFLSLLVSVATGVITFLCTRKCYKKSSPPSPNEKSVYYETVPSVSVQMQPSPAYESVEKKI